MQEKPSIRANAISFNQKTGIGKITIHGRLALNPDADDPVIEIWNAVQQKMQSVVNSQGEKKKELIYFTPLCPHYNEEDDVTTDELIPTRRQGVPIEGFVAEAKITLDVFYKKLFIACFHAFLEDRNEICNYNGYSLYQECIKKIEAAGLDSEKRASYLETTKMLLESFIEFIGLPLPHSKKNMARKARAKIRYTIKDFDETFDVPV